MQIMKIVSGGQTGADRGGLDAAITYKVLHGGWCTRGRKAEDGEIPKRYHLQETSSTKYLVRTERNVTDSDGTVVFTFGPPTGGNKRTIQFAKRHNKPCLHVDLDAVDDDTATAAVQVWLASDAFAGDLFTPAPETITLNIAGSRESKAPGIQARTKGIVSAVLKS